jgi:hypothetical protein
MNRRSEFMVSVLRVAFGARMPKDQDAPRLGPAIGLLIGTIFLPVILAHALALMLE